MLLLLPDSGLIFWTLLSFGIVFTVLVRYDSPVIIKMVEGRKTYVDESLEIVREANAQLSRLKEEGKAIVAAANKEQGRIAKEAIQEHEKITYGAHKQAEVTVQGKLDEVRRRAQIGKEEVIHDIHRQVALLSADIAEKVIRKNLADKQGQMGMIDRMLDEVPTES